MKLIYLTALVTAPNEAGEEKIERTRQLEKEVDRVDYHSMGIRPPKGEVDVDEYGNVLLDEEDFEEIGVPVTIPLKNISSYVATLEGGTLVYTTNGIAYNVEEEVWMIDSYIDMVTMNWFEKLKLSFLSFWRKIMNKKQTNGEIQ